MRGQPVVYETLDRLGIPYECMEHAAVYTVEEMDRLPFPADVRSAKNLFLRDAKGKRHFLVTIAAHKQADLRALGEKLGGTRLSFASEDRLRKYLALPKGSVSPFGVLNDVGKTVEVFLDADLEPGPRVGVHPNDNTATLFVAFADIVRAVGDHGNPLHIVRL